MGVYYTCNICGKTEKGMFPCDCHLQLARVELKTLEGKTILSSSIVKTNGDNVLVMKVQDMTEWNSEIYYVVIDAGGPANDGDWNRADVEFVEQGEYEEMLSGDQDSDETVVYNEEDTEDEEATAISEPKTSQPIQGFTFQCSAKIKPAEICTANRDRIVCSAHQAKGIPCEKTARPFDSKCAVHAESTKKPMSKLVTDVFIRMGKFGKSDDFSVCLTCDRSPSMNRQTLLVCDFCLSDHYGYDYVEEIDLATGTITLRNAGEQGDEHRAFFDLEEFAYRMSQYKARGYDSTCSAVNGVICWSFHPNEEIRLRKGKRDPIRDEDNTIAVAKLPQTTKDIFIAKGICGWNDTLLSCVMCGDTTSIYRQCFLACDRCVLMSQEHKFLEIGNHAGGFVQFRVYDPDEDTEYGGMPITLEEFGKRLQHYRDLKYTLSAGVVDQVISWTCTETEESRDEERGDLDVFG